MYICIYIYIYNVCIHMGFAIDSRRRARTQVPPQAQRSHAHGSGSKCAFERYGADAATSSGLVRQGAARRHDSQDHHCNCDHMLLSESSNPRSISAQVSKQFVATVAVASPRVLRTTCHGVARFRRCGPRLVIINMFNIVDDNSGNNNTYYYYYY